MKIRGFEEKMVVGASGGESRRVWRNVWSEYVEIA